jgi:CPA1 family monovalent cation:H+ antiporter
LVRWLKLDQLSPIDQALRHQVLALQLARVRDQLRQTADDFSFLPEARKGALEFYDELAEAEASANTFDAALTDRDRVKLGLLTFASQERTILLTIFRERGVSFGIMEQLLRTADVIIDATQAEGRLGYQRAARRRLRPSAMFRLADRLHRSARIDWPLTRLMAQRFEMLQVMRLVFLSQLRFMQERMTPVLGERVTEVLGEVVQRRGDLLDDSMKALELLYPGHAEALQNAILRQIGLRYESNAYILLHGEALLSDELFEELQRDVENRRDAIPFVKPIKLQSALSQRLHGLAPFDRLRESVLDDVARQTTMCFVLPGDRILRRRRRARSVYVISSGEVEIERDGRRIRLGQGGLFGGDGVFGEAETRGAVTATRFCHLFVLRTEVFRRVLTIDQPGASGGAALVEVRGGDTIKQLPEPVSHGG